MDKKEKIRRIAEVLQANEVSFDDDFCDLIANGYGSDGCQELSDVLVDDVYALAGRGMNDDFKLEKDAIQDLISLAVKLSEPKAAKKLNTYKEKREKLLSEVKNPKIKEGKMDFKGEVIKYLDFCDKAADAAAKVALTPASIANFQRSQELLGELRGTIEEVWDNTSADALKKANDVVNAIYDWVQCCKTSSCESRHIAVLEEALKQARQWRSITKIGKKPSKDDLNTYNISFEEAMKSVTMTNVTWIVKGATYLRESMASTQAIIAAQENMLNDNINKYIFEYEQDIKRCDEETAELEKEKQDIVLKNKNGELAPGSAEKQRAIRRYNSIKEEIADLQKSSLEAQRMLRRMRNQSQATRKKLRTVKGIVSFINSCSINVVLFAKIMERIGVDSLQQLVTGSLTNAEMERFIDGFISAQAEIVAEENISKEFVINVDKLYEAMDGYRVEEKETVSAEDLKLQEDEFDRETAALTGDADTALEAEEEEEEKLRRGAKPFSDDDM